MISMCSCSPLAGFCCVSEDYPTLVALQATKLSFTHCIQYSAGGGLRVNWKSLLPEVKELSHVESIAEWARTWLDDSTTRALRWAVRMTWFCQALQLMIRMLYWLCLNCETVGQSQVKGILPVTSSGPLKIAAFASFQARFGDCCHWIEKGPFSGLLVGR